MRLVILIAAFFVPSVADADQWINTFEGELPDGASSHSQISDGESFIAQFNIDSTAEDMASSPNIGAYAAILFGAIEFSGGYTSSIDIDPTMLVRVFPELEVVSIFDSDLDFAAQVFNDFSNVLESDQLPGPGTFMETETRFDFLAQLIFSDEFGTVAHDTSMAQNVTFSVSGIPEPTGAGIGVLCSLFVMLRRKR